MRCRLALPLALAATVLASPAQAQRSGFTSARVLVPGVMGPPVSNWRAACSSVGFVRLIMLDGSPYDIFTSVGTGGEDGIGILGVAATGAPSPAATCIITGLSNPDPETRR